MAEMCCGVVSEGEAPLTACESSSRVARRRRMEIRRFKFVIGVAQPEAAAVAVEEEKSLKRPKLEVYAATSFSLDGENAVDDDGENSVKVKNGRSETKGGMMRSRSSPSLLIPLLNPEFNLKFGFTSVCGRRRDMEDAVAIHPSFHRQGQDTGATTQLHYFGVYDGHGCSHVAMRCRERLHDLVKEELGGDGECEWRIALERSFTRMDKEVIKWNESVVGASCRCELQSPECDAAGSTAVVAIVTPDKIVVANCGDSRAVLCRKGKAVPLSSDHKVSTQLTLCLVCKKMKEKILISLTSYILSKTKVND
ncbi:hypothetical protein SLEP1_g41518 [Rubroshorea leprosula]|uniref:protein-serine/threonine phosphatase n=1 Tax=Rubroshorea leprosula TaxID=152421 RepID=A0AAV5L738_9ROSI|nr:hypothetical protein SLEP1_g41518 [Rubroshorea leprosula]